MGFPKTSNAAMEICTLQNVAAQNIADTTNVPVVFSGLVGTDPNGYWSAGSPDRLTVPAGHGGIFMIECAFQFAASAAGTLRTLKISVSGVTVAELIRPGAGGAVPVSIDLEKTARLVAGDTIQMLAFQDTGGILVLNSTAPRTPTLTIVRLAA